MMDGERGGVYELMAWVRGMGGSCVFGYEGRVWV